MPSDLEHQRNDVPGLMANRPRMNRVTDPTGNRRSWLKTGLGGIAGIALADLMHRETVSADAVLHHAPKAKRVVQLFMAGAASHVDTFDYKPELQKRDGQPWDPGEQVELFQSQRELLPVGFNKLQRLYQAEEAHALSQRAAILPWEEAEKDFQRAIEQLDGLTKNNDAVTLWRYLGFARLGLADRLISQGELDSAKETLNTAIDNFAPLIEFGEVNDLRGVARVHQRIGTIEMDQGRIEAATEQFRMAEAILTEAASLTPDHQPLRESIASLWISQAKSLHLSGHTREAQLALQRAVEL